MLAEHGVRQLHSAETEKYAHVTYFFNGGREEEFAGEDRILVPSPRDVPSYDHKPEMSAPEVAERVVRAIEEDGYGFVVVNFANPDMVGHTGVIPAVVEAVETADACLGRVVDAVERRGRRLARHRRPRQRGAAPPGRRQPAHGPHDEPGALDSHGPQVRLCRDGELSDLAPTILALLGLRWVI